MSRDRSSDPRKQLSEEIWEELLSLNGKGLDDYLTGIGLEPDELLRSYSSGVKSAAAAPKRARFEEARRLIRERQAPASANVLLFDMDRKKKIAASIRDLADRTNDMTVAARNRTIEDENDLDVFLHACLQLGVIDDEGNLKG
jgi:hypothetical protein